MIEYPNINPVALLVGDHEIRWYSLAYMAGLLFVRWSLRDAVRRGRLAGEMRNIDAYLLICVLSMYLWGRVVHALLYDSTFAFAHPFEVLAPGGGGLAFHGALIGIGLASWAVAKAWGVTFLGLTDELVVAVPFAIGLGRLGNFANQELWGRITDVPWGMVFPLAGAESRHPSQLYESLLEGWLLLVVMRGTLHRPMVPGRRTALFLALYAVARFVGEAFRQPDGQVGLLAGSLSLGQWLSVATLAVSAAIFASAKQPT